MTSLKELAVSHAVLDGKLTFHMLPFRTLAVESTISALESLSPHWNYVHSKTGKQTTTMPADYRLAVEKWQNNLTPEIVSVWTQVSLWGAAQNSFAVLEPLTVDVVVADGKLSAEVSAFLHYWQNRPDDLSERWALFQQLVSTRLSNAWWAAYQATRDTSLDGDPALASEVSEDADPKESPPEPVP